MSGFNPVAGAPVGAIAPCFVEFEKPKRFNAHCGCICYAIRFLPVQVGGFNVQSPLRLHGTECLSQAYNENEVWLAEKDSLYPKNGAVQQVLGAISNAYSYSARAFSGPEPTGLGSENVGSITLENCGALDALLDRYFEARPVEIYAGDCCDSDVSNYELVFKGVAKAATWTDTQITIGFGDRRTQATNIATMPTYGGSGGYDGDANVSGKVKPWVWGTVKNITPVLIDSLDQLYQFGQSGISVNAVRDRGVNLTNAGDTTSLLSATVPAGSYMTDLSRGLIKLGSPPDGAITADIVADGTSTGDVLRSALKSAFGVNSYVDDDFDAFSFSRLDNLAPWNVGYYLDGQKTMSEIADELMIAIGGYWFFTRAGLLAVGLPWGLDLGNCLTLEECDLVGPWIHENAGLPSYERRVFYDRNWTQQTDLAGATNQSNLSFYQGEGRIVSQTSPNLQLAGRSVDTRSYLVNKSSAEALVGIMRNHYGTRRDIYQIDVACGLLRYRLGDCVILETDRFGASQGSQYQVIGIDERADRNTARIRLARVA